MLFFKDIKQHWFFTYKIYHFPFWAFYFFSWGVIELSLPIAYKAMFFSPRYVIFLFYVVIHTLANYFNLYVLLPKYLYKGKLTTYILSLVSWIAVVSCVMFGCYFLSAFIIGESLDYFCVFNEEKGETYFHTLTSQILPATSGTMLLGLCIKLAKNSLIAQKKQQLLENEKLATELKFLKHQFNPHFLFNTINSIFFLIHKAPGEASEALANFSDLLRYQLYECNEQLIPIDQELNYLENFVALEKLRRNKNLKIDLSVHLSNKKPLGIAPFILVTFVENAFKHVSNSKEMLNWIEIKVEVDDNNCLHFDVTNSIETKSDFNTNLTYGGIGLENVSRRLDLIYSKNYDLKIDHQKTRFSVALKITLEELVLKDQISQERNMVS
ncbi:sensor histidine kinase [Aquimarina litoralis]|uniref:sensor histidine kinase n=1 Tax=Aquimarina litoralis TaxID=584605 RepID=UPI001C5A0946|nr:histidine kinase [Aquimarina litoralis]MBW1295221.1 GHKL domain-containing protein [Aquimarina litoralis]